MKKIILIFSITIFLFDCQSRNPIIANNDPSQKMIDSVYVSRHETETLELYTLYYDDGNSLQKIYEIQTEDGSSLSYMYSYDDNNKKYKCFILNNNSADCNRFIFFNYSNRKFYITTTCFSGFCPQKNNIDFDRKILVLDNDYTKGDKDIVIDKTITYIPYSDTIKSIKAHLKILTTTNSPVQRSL